MNQSIRLSVMRESILIVESPGAVVINLKIGMVIRPVTQLWAQAAPARYASNKIFRL